MATDLEKKFKKAAWLITNGPPRPGTPTDVKLQYYSLFKQATVGDVTGEQPWAVQFEVGASMIRELCETPLCRWPGHQCRKLGSGEHRTPA